jgi:hypothetical protein
MKEITLTSHAVIIVCVDAEGTYTWVARSPEQGNVFIQENMQETYDIEPNPENKVWCDGSWLVVSYGYGNEVKYKMDYIDVVEVQ